MRGGRFQLNLNQLKKCSAVCSPCSPPSSRPLLFACCFPSLVPSSRLETHSCSLSLSLGLHSPAHSHAFISLSLPFSFYLCSPSPFPFLSGSDLFWLFLALALAPLLSVSCSISDSWECLSWGSQPGSFGQSACLNTNAERFMLTKSSIFVGTGTLFTTLLETFFNELMA